MPQWVDESVFERSWMTTNDGSRSGFIRFDPRALLQAPCVTVGALSVAA